MIFFFANTIFIEQRDCAYESAMKRAVKTLLEFIKIWDIEKLSGAYPSKKVGLAKIPEKYQYPNP